MAAKENILERLRANIGERFEMPDIVINAIHYDNVVEKFAETCRTVSGAEVVMGTPAEEDKRGEISTVRGDIGVAENGCIWIPQREADRSFLFRSEHLNIIVKASDIVSNMHEAYARISESEEYFKDYKYGTFISGPSKTADIEGALVYGAQAARSVTVFIE